MDIDIDMADMDISVLLHVQSHRTTSSKSPERSSRTLRPQLINSTVIAGILCFFCVGFDEDNDAWI